MLTVPLGEHFPRESMEVLIPKFKKKKAFADTGRYGIDPHLSPTHWEGPLYFETNRGLKFTYRSDTGPVTVAFAGFEVLSSSLLISQLQGRKGAHDLLKPFVWEQMLVEAVIVLARATSGCEEVRIQRASALPFYHTPHYLTMPHEEHRRLLERRYDGTAARLGFAWAPSKAAYCFDLRTGAP